MVRIMENWSTQLISRTADMRLVCIVLMLAGIINVLPVKENAP